METKKAIPAQSVLEKRVPEIKPGKYADGIPYNDIEYLAFKMLLKPNHFISRQSLQDFAKVVKRPAADFKITFDMQRFITAPVKIREVLFLDTSDFRLYNNAFILRRRFAYEDGFPSGVPEMVFKFRHADIQKAAETDVRPHIQGDYDIKFKCQLLPLKTELGGTRILYSHNIQFPRDHMEAKEVMTFDAIAKILPALEFLRKKPGEKLALVNHVFIEEVLLDIGSFNFGGGLFAKANVAIWRTRGDHRPLIGEFAYQLHFNNRKDVKPELAKRAEEFFIALQYAAKHWIALNSTKTGVVYNLLGHKSNSAE
jgi:hypothetical protein